MIPRELSLDSQLITCSSGSTWGKCLKNFFVLELLSSFRFFSFFSASFEGTTATAASPEVSGLLEEDFRDF